ncbi:MAG: sensor histidine kinase, partial [Mycobacteriaceae bacterium]
AEAVVREAVSNAVRHSGAENLMITVAVHGEELRISVGDDGIGIPAEARQSGLRNLRDRADGAGGTFAVTQRVGGGTQLDWAARLG